MANPISIKIDGMKDERPVKPSIEQAPRPLGRPSAAASDADLLCLVATGDRDAFKILWERFGPGVFTLCLRRLGDRQAAEDAAQETFTSLWRRAETFDPDRGSAAAWLYAVARNAAGQLARRRPQEVLLTVLPAEEAGEDDEALTRLAIHAALTRIAAAERQVLELAYFQDLSQSQIAERLKLPLGTIKSRTRSALQKMASYLEEGAP